MKHITALLLTLFTVSWSANSSAALYGFSCGTNNSATNCALSEDYLLLEVLAVDNDTVEFTLTNSGELTTHLTKVWVDDDAGLLNINTGTTETSTGVSFGSVDPSTQNIGGLDFIAEAEALRTNQGGVSNGVTSGTGLNEWLTLEFDLAVADTFDILLAALETGSFKIGVHIQAYADGGSEKLSTPSAVPVPAAFWLFGSALLGFIGFSRRTSV